MVCGADGKAEACSGWGLSPCGVLDQVPGDLDRTMTGEDAARLIDDALDLVHQRLTAGRD